MTDSESEALDGILFNLMANSLGVKGSSAIGKRAKSEAKAQLQALLDAARLEGLQQAQSIVLRRTEIPKDAKTPTRDAIVILGEEIANIIQQDIEALQAEKEEL